jgi:predicted enzyme related to lactoylglutathione lyase
LVTADQPTSGAFFSQLLGWTRKEVDAGRFGTYTLFQRDGQDVAGMMNPTPETPGKGSFWHSYIAVEDVDDCAKRSTALGGGVVVAPHDVPDVGRVCAVADPTGAVAHLMQPLNRNVGVREQANRNEARPFKDVPRAAPKSSAQPKRRRCLDDFKAPRMASPLGG